MAARPDKCWSLALKKFPNRYQRYNPLLTISCALMNYLDDGDFQYLGRPTNAFGSEATSWANIELLLINLTQLVDALTLPASAKLWLYQHFVIAKMSWSVTVHDLSKTFVSKLQAMANTYLKKWAALPRPANTAILFIGSSDRAGLHILNLVTVWKQM